MAMTESTPPPPPTKALPAIPKSPEPVDSSRSSRSSSSLRRKPVPNSVPHSIPSFSIDEHEDTLAGGRESRQSGYSFAMSSAEHSRTPSRDTPDPAGPEAMPVTRDIPIRQLNINNSAYPPRFSSAAELDIAGLHDGTDLSLQNLSLKGVREQHDQQPYYKQPTPPPPSVSPREHVQSPSAGSGRSSTSDNSGNRNNFNFGFEGPLQVPRTTIQRPNSAYTLGSELNNTRGASHSPHLSVGGSPVNGSTASFARTQAAHRRSPENRNSSYLDLLKLPYHQQIAPTTNLLNAHLKHAVGENASLLDTKKTLDMYRANVKSQDNVVQYEFALYMVQIAREVTALPQSTESHGLVPADLLREARQILTRLADRGYPFAQYYLGDGYASGLFNKDKPDYNTAFNYFIAANKHGHAESSYRAALCYEFGWGCRKDYAKAAQYYRTAASKNHPGAAARLGRACLTGDMGLLNKYREGVKWLKRATESADYQYNSAPYELGLLHETGYGEDIFKDEVYAVQLFTQAAELGHPQAALKLGEAYEHGLLRCPKDAALSVHYYNCAAQADIPEAMMNLCAWYLLGAPPVLEKDENEAYEWAKKAAVEHGLPKAEYACGYFTEMGIGCRRDPLEANVWYVKAADHGDERAKQRLAIIQAAASGEGPSPSTEKTKLKKGGKDENCLVM